MNVDKFLPIAIVVFLVVSFMAFLYFITGFSAVTRPLIAAGQADIPSYTANSSAWEGFSATFTAAPLLIFLIFVGMICFGAFKLVMQLRNKSGGR